MKGRTVVEEFELDGKRYLLIGHAVPNLACLAELTASELDVARMLIAGDSMREIATARGTAVRTVANQIAQLYRKSGVSSREELIDLVNKNTHSKKRPSESGRSAPTAARKGRHR